MKLSDEKIMRLFRAAHFEKEKIPVPDGWQNDVMRRVRHLEPLASGMAGILMFDRFVWRFAAAACVVVLLLSVYVFQAGFQPEYELTRMFMNDPVGFSLVESVGIL